MDRCGPGAKLIAEGAEQEPIEFVRADPNNDWDRISLLSSSGNSIKWALFDGGYINLSIASKNNTISHSTFRNATYRTLQGWHNQDGNGNASATITYSLIENSATVGIVAQYIDLDISHTTIKSNGEDGLYVHSGTVYPFYQNLVTNNGTSVSYRDGVQVKYSGTFYMLGSSYTEGYNEVSNNADDQILTYGDTIVGAALGGNGGYNSIKGNFLGSKYLVDNNSGSSVNATGTWWGQSSTDPAMFDGSVSGVNLFSDPTSSPGNDGESPSKAVTPPAVNFDKLFNQAEQNLSEARSSGELRERLHRLYQLEGLARNEQITTRFLQLAKEVARGEHSTFATQALNTRAKHLSGLFYTKSLIRNEGYGEAHEYLSQMETNGFVGLEQREYLELLLTTQQYHGQYELALQTLEALYQGEESRGMSMEEITSQYSVIEETLLERIKSAEGTRDSKNNKEQHETEQQASELNIQAYPNPFNPTTNITFSLPDKAAVSLIIYDMLGRKVATLVDGELAAGEQTLRFDASNLANGMYLYELRTANQVIVKKMTLIK